MADEEIVYEGRPLSEEDKFYFQWALESPKLSLAVVRDLLSKMITLATGLAGGSAAFLSDQIVPQPVKLVAIVAFLFALVAATLGIMPREDMVEESPEAIKASKLRALDTKSKFLFASTLSILIGLVMVAGGVACKVVNPDPSTRSAAAGAR